MKLIDIIPLYSALSFDKVSFEALKLFITQGYLTVDGETIRDPSFKVPEQCKIVIHLEIELDKEKQS